MDTPESLSAADSPSAPTKIAVPRLLDLGKEVSYEDVLAARVFRKTLLAQGFVFGVIVLLLTYVGLDLQGKSNAIREEQDKLAAEQKEFHREMNEVRTRIQQYETQMRDRVGEANGLVKAASEVFKSTDAYQSALAGQLHSIGQMQRHTQELQAADTSLRRQVAEGLGRVDGAVTAATQQRLQDSVTLASTLENVQRATRGLSNTVIQVVEEDAPTPIGNSDFTFEYDGLRERGCIIGRVQLHHNRAMVPGWPRDQVMVGVPTQVEVDGQRYWLTVLQGFSRRSQLTFWDYSHRILVQLKKLDDPNETPRVVPCEPAGTE